MNELHNKKNKGIKCKVLHKFSILTLFLSCETSMTFAELKYST